MDAPLYQVQISKDDAAVTDPWVAEQTLQMLGIEFDHVETDGAGGEDAGIWLVGLTGELGRLAAAGVETSVAEGGLLVEVSQP